MGRAPIMHLPLPLSKVTPSNTAADMAIHTITMRRLYVYSSRWACDLMAAALWLVGQQMAFQFTAIWAREE